VHTIFSQWVRTRRESLNTHRESLDAAARESSPREDSLSPNDVSRRDATNERITDRIIMYDTVPEETPLTRRRASGPSWTTIAVGLAGVVGVALVATSGTAIAPTLGAGFPVPRCPKADWVDDSKCAPNAALGAIEIEHRGRALLGSKKKFRRCAKLPARPKSADSKSCHGHGICHEATSASGNKPFCDCDAGYGGKHCETKILSTLDLSVKLASVEEELEKLNAQIADATSEEENQ